MLTIKRDDYTGREFTSLVERELEKYKDDYKMTHVTVGNLSVSYKDSMIDKVKVEYQDFDIPLIKVRFEGEDWENNFTYSERLEEMKYIKFKELDLEDHREVTSVEFRSTMWQETVNVFLERVSK